MDLQPKKRVKGKKKSSFDDETTITETSLVSPQKKKSKTSEALFKEHNSKCNQESISSILRKTETQENSLSGDLLTPQKSPVSINIDLHQHHEANTSPMSQSVDMFTYNGNKKGEINDSHSIASRQSMSSYSSGHTVFQERYTISIDELMGENPKLRKTIIYLLLMRVVSSSNNNESRPYMVKNFKKKQYNESKSNYSRLFLCMDVNSTSGQTVYLAQGKGIGVNLWSKAANRRDDGYIGIGTVVAVPSPKPITKLLANEVPIIESNASLLVCNKYDMETIRIDQHVPENSTRGFILNGCTMRIKTAEVVNSECSGYFCDRQRSSELLRTGKKCGCYVMRGFVSSLAVVHNIEIIPCDEGGRFQMKEFSSIKFSLLYLKEYFPKSTKRISFDVTQNEDDLYESMDNVVEFYNSNGGFTVLGWYKRGEVNDLNRNEENNEKISSSTISHHVTSVYPSNFIREHATQTEHMKFDVSNIE